MIESLSELTARYPKLKNCEADIRRSADLLIDCFESGHRLYLCGNGGSAADADHIVGELMKGFLKRRPLSPAEKTRFSPEDAVLAESLMGGLPAISLHSQASLLTAYINDANAAMVYAQALYSLGQPGDVLLAISTSGNSENIVFAAKTARALGMNVITLTGDQPCRLDALSHIAIHAGERETYRVQELHLPIYHWLCAAIEDHFFAE